MTLSSSPRDFQCVYVHVRIRLPDCDFSPSDLQSVYVSLGTGLLDRDFLYLMCVRNFLLRDNLTETFKVCTLLSINHT